jgi:hypothetical protein
MWDTNQETYLTSKCEKVKQSLDRPRGFLVVEATIFQDNQYMTVVRLSPYAPATFTLGKYSWY